MRRRQKLGAGVPLLKKESPSFRAERTSSVDQFLDFLGRCGGALRKRAHFARDNREASALFTRARSFNGSIQGENVGLERDAFDRPVISERSSRRVSRQAISRLASMEKRSSNGRLELGWTVPRRPAPSPSSLI